MKATVDCFNITPHRLLFDVSLVGPKAAGFSIKARDRFDDRRAIEEEEISELYQETYSLYQREFSARNSHSFEWWSIFEIQTRIVKFSSF